MPSTYTPPVLFLVNCVAPRLLSVYPSEDGLPDPNAHAHLRLSFFFASPTGFNGITDQGATSLARGLAHNSSLRTLYLSGNSIGAAGAGAIADALARNTRLTTLHLSVSYSISLSLSLLYVKQATGKMGCVKELLRCTCLHVWQYARRTFFV